MAGQQMHYLIVGGASYAGSIEGYGCKMQKGQR